MYCTKTIASRDEKQLSFGIGVLYIRDFTIIRVTHRVPCPFFNTFSRQITAMPTLSGSTWSLMLRLINSVISTFEKYALHSTFQNSNIYRGVAVKYASIKPFACSMSIGIGNRYFMYKAVVIWNTIFEINSVDIKINAFNQHLNTYILSKSTQAIH